ncbi:MAG: hypothetical protein SPI62_05915 [Candidatus Enteromonas sp.]|nr:hypothetical protein [bacterium]MDD6917387.1 hypothetical protein [bacterium]MDY6101378.1 hypothetical protein [Candidatus Enteromonas sp.]
MITFQILGLDQFVVGHYSKEHTANLAQLYESDESLINFYAPNSMVFHDGVEQTSWNTIVIVRAPEKFKPMEAHVANYLIQTLSEFSINLEIEFEYFSSSSRYEHINESYPRFIREENIKEADVTLSNDMPDLHEEETECCEGDECECHHCHPHEEEKENDQEIFLGDAFAGLDDKLK